MPLHRVGLGVHRVHRRGGRRPRRDLFETAKNSTPAIIFIDELDAIGRTHDSLSVGGHDEREQTLNQILTEMDRFTGTGRRDRAWAPPTGPRSSSPALLRQERFDAAHHQPPDQAGRRQILDVRPRRAAGRRYRPGRDLASATPGMVEAELANLVGEAALQAARRNHTEVHQADFTDALERIVLGSERRIMLSAEDAAAPPTTRPAALLGMLTPGADPVRKISIVPRGHATRVTFQSPDADRYSYSASYLRGRIAGMPWPAGPPRNSSTTTSPPAPRTTPSRPPASPSRWSGAGACPRRWGCCRRCPTRRERP